MNLRYVHDQSGADALRARSLCSSNNRNDDDRWKQFLICPVVRSHLKRAANATVKPASKILLQSKQAEETELPLGKEKPSRLNQIKSNQKCKK
ncbi:hypothetical protein DPX16_2002 [Anabarilius grahami]|uniref:Uncharacterized protein n=1 Tax=Anabarilius grahami TaxID=495550 RepID=A0A3N0XSR4_ANAGA|nr:hypothetical protein DPX16_2002 [Anabarilius grahami]